MKTEEFLAAEREEMVVDQISRRGLQNPRLLEAFRKIPRHLFVPGDLINQAYRDGPLSIGCGQTISQPYIVALMTSLMALQGDETVLEIGTGSGYQAAILSCLAEKVYTIEVQSSLADRARLTLQGLGIANVDVHIGDGSLGWTDAAPYQAIMVTAAAPAPPAPLLQQLAEGGRLVLPVGPRQFQELQVWERTGQSFSEEHIIPVAFVPLRGRYGWNDEKWPEH
jgi:protein-L-isoaspartate(D-aspartate) O-methyltransferase